MTGVVRRGRLQDEGVEGTDVEASAIITRQGCFVYGKVSSSGNSKKLMKCSKKKREKNPSQYWHNIYVRHFELRGKRNGSSS